MPYMNVDAAGVICRVRASMGCKWVVARVRATEAKETRHIRYWQLQYKNPITTVNEGLDIMRMSMNCGPLEETRDEGKSVNLPRAGQKGRCTVGRRHRSRKARARQN